MFKQNVDFVRPLYRKVKFGNQVKPMRKVFVSVDVIGDNNPCGDEIRVKRIVRDKNNYNVLDLNGVNSDNILPGACDSKNQKLNSELKTIQHVNKSDKKVKKNVEYTSYNLNLPNVGYGKMDEHRDFISENNSKYIQAKNSLLLIETVKF